MASRSGKWGDKPPEKWKLKGEDSVNAQDLMTWLREMSEWAARVREDIKTLERRAGLPPGDPGAPPPPPE